MITATPKRIPIFRRTIDCFRPPPRIVTYDWICKNGRTKKNMPFNRIDFPWVRGIAEDWESFSIERQFFMACSRLGKTETAIQLVLCSIANDPDLAMVGGPTKEKIQEWIVDRIYPMALNIGPLRNWVPPEHKRGKLSAKLAHATIYGAWSGSPTTLGDLDPRYIMAFEIDKWSKAASEESDPFDLILARGSEIPDRRFFAESTPTIDGLSRIQRFVANGTDCRFNVPCPLCGHYQPLVLGNGKPKSGGIKWDKDAKTGHSTPVLAFSTARYCCRKCFGEWPNEARMPAVRKGVWVPKGCSANRNGTVVGKRTNDVPDASYQMNRLYSPSFSFGHYARAYVECEGIPSRLQAFANDWEGLPFFPVKRTHAWETVAEKLSVEGQKLHLVPEPGIFLTCAVDVQIDHLVYMVVAWSAGKRGYVVDYGSVFSWGQLKDDILPREYAHADGGPPLTIQMTLVDARDGNRKDEIVDACRSMNSESGPWVWPSMGAKAGAMGLNPFEKRPFGKGNELKKKTNAQFIGFGLVMVNTSLWQEWIQGCLDLREPGAPDSLSFPESCRTDEDLFKQLLNEEADWSVGTTGHDVVKYVRVDRLIPVDLRDAARYSRCAAEVFVNSNWSRTAEKRFNPGRAPDPPRPKRNANDAPTKPIVAEEDRSRWVRRMMRRRVR